MGWFALTLLVTACTAVDGPGDTGDTADTGVPTDTTDTTDTGTRPDTSDTSTQQSGVDAYCDLELSCDDYFTTHEECTGAVNAEIGWASGESSGCGAAAEALYACLGALPDCGAFDDYWTESTPNYPCSAQDAAYYEACAPGDTNDTDDTSDTNDTNDTGTTPGTVDAFCDYEWACFEEDWIDRAECVAFLDLWIDDAAQHSTACRDTLIAVFDCVAANPSGTSPTAGECDALDDWWSETPPYLCQAEQEANYAACDDAPAPDAVAEAFCDFEYACFPEDWDDHDECVDDTMSFLADAILESAACYDAEVTLYACLTALQTGSTPTPSECNALDDWWYGESPYPCEDEEDAAIAICGW